ncbi:hypothetical protein MPER_10337 [Moniliophthora perniciosa FA553]|nr:hypothetical protein MPER_10337 [Moniliophthora perniciosa FA553]
MGLVIPNGGHYTPVKTQALASQAKIFNPRLIISGASAYPRDWEYAKLREITDKEGNWLIAPLTTVMLSQLPRLIFFRKDLENAKDLEKRVNEGVADPAFKAYAKQVVANARTLAAALAEHGYKLQTGGSDNHLVLWDLRPLGLTGSKVEKICDLMGITINKNAVSGDASAQVPGGIRLGTSALTSRNMTEKDIKVVADFLHRSIQLSLLLQKEAGSKLLKDFVRVATTQEEGKQGFAQVKQLRDEVRAFAKQWPLPGVDAANFKKPAGVDEN